MHHTPAVATDCRLTHASCAHPMRLYPGKITPIAKAVVKRLLAENLIETDNPAQVSDDLTAVLQAYHESERDIQAQTRDILSSRQLPHHEAGRIRRLVAEQKGIGIGDEMIDYLLDQLTAMLMNSNAVEEVFGEDVELRRCMAPILKQELAVDQHVEQEARSRLKHLQEGTASWDIEYRKVMEDIRRRKGL